jgi:hypothetical protein
MTRSKQLLTGGGVAILAASALLIATAPPALAHYIVVYQGKDMASVSADHARASVCDREKDGNAVYAVVWTGFRYVKEWDGGDRGCDNLNDLESHEVVKQIRVCENTRRGDNDACSAWEMTHPWGANVSAR